MTLSSGLKQFKQRAEIYSQLLGTFGFTNFTREREIANSLPQDILTSCYCKSHFTQLFSLPVIVNHIL